MSAIHHYWQARPRLLNNPIIRRELLERLRRGGSFFQLGIFLLTAMIVILFNWSNYVTQYANITYGPSSREYFILLNFWLGVIALFIVPSLSAACVNIERERKTWDLVATTPISLSSILLGKFLSAVLFVWLLIISLIPIYGICFTMGGVAPEEVAFVFLMILEVIVICALFGMYASIAYSRTIRSISMAYGMVFLYFVLWPILGLMLVNLPSLPFIGIFCLSCIVITSPIAITMFFFEGKSALPNPVDIFISPYAIHGIEMMCLILFFVWLCMRKLSKHQHRSEPGRYRRNRKPITVQPSESTTKPEIVIPEAQLIPDRRNPIHYKEIQEFSGRKPIRFVLSLLALFLFGLIVLTFRLDTRIHFSLDWSPLAAFFAILVTPCLILSYGAYTFRSEYDRETWELLRTTTLSPWRIVWGKLMAGIQLFGWRFFAFYGFSLLVGIFLGANDITGNQINDSSQAFYQIDFILGSFIVCLISGVFYLGLAIGFSVWFKKTVHAYIVSFVSAFFFLIGFILLLRFINPYADRTITFLSSLISPLFLCANYGSGWGLHSGTAWWFALLIQAGWMLSLTLLCCWIATERIKDRS